MSSSVELVAWQARRPASVAPVPMSAGIRRAIGRTAVGVTDARRHFNPIPASPKALPDRQAGQQRTKPVGCSSSESKLTTGTRRPTHCAEKRPSNSFKGLAADATRIADERSGTAPGSLGRRLRLTSRTSMPTSSPRIDNGMARRAARPCHLRGVSGYAKRDAQNTSAAPLPRSSRSVLDRSASVEDPRVDPRLV